MEKNMAFSKKILASLVTWLLLISINCQADSTDGLSQQYTSDQPTNNIILKWPSDSGFIWRYSKLNKPEWLTNSQAKTLFTNAAQAWSSCGVAIHYAGELDEEAGTPNANNLLGWGNLPPRIRGFTYRRQAAGKLVGSSIVINNENEDIKNNPVLLQKVVTHEFGHALGLIHSKGCRDVMSSAAICGNPSFPPPVVPTENDLIQCQMRYGNK